jgi:hypothetical protein
VIIQGQSAGLDVTISLKDASLAISLGEQEIVARDRAGRLYSLYQNGRHYRRSLNGQILQKQPTAAGRQRRWLDPIEADALIDFTAQRFRQVLDALRRPDWKWNTPPDQPAVLSEVFAAIELGAHFDSVTAQADAAQFAAVYSPIGILPPDQYLALVLQATEGCSFNSCTFCDLYHQPFRIKTPNEFRTHLQNVRAYLGDSLLLRNRSIFLGAANALAIPMPRLWPIFDIIAEEFPATGIYAFLDAFTGTRKDIDDYRALAERGLRRVYIGLESGHDPLLELVRKPGHAADAIETVRAIKAAGINVGVIVMIGLGGDRFSTGHIADTIDVLNAMQLGAGDLIYFSDLIEEPGTSYPALALDHSIRTLTSEERSAQRTAIRNGLRVSDVKISNYDVREFVY